MKRRTLLALSAALALTVCVTTAAGGGGSKQVKGSLSGSYGENFVTGLLGGQSTGTVTHFGRATLGLSLTPGPSFQPATYETSGTWTLTAANGDAMNGTATGPCTRSSDFVQATCVLDLTSGGGTGRFEGASATFTATTVITRVSCDELKPFCSGVITSELVGQLLR
jgi:hypothetical protein